MSSQTKQLPQQAAQQGQSLPAIQSSVPVSPFETATSGAAAAAQAEVQAAYVVAFHRPRDIEKSRERILSACKRLGFARAAKYSLPRKQWDPEKRKEKTIRLRGLSVRAAEEIERDLGNIRRNVTIAFEDETKRFLQVTVVDLENNNVLTAPVSVAKTVERKKLYGKENVLAERVTSTGGKVFIVAATDSEINMKQEALVSKARRNLVIQLLPGDIRQEAEDQIDRTILEAIVADPKEFQKTIREEFKGTGIKPSQIHEYLGHEMEKSGPEELQELLEIASSLRDGDLTWEEVMEARRAEVGDPQADADTKERADLLALLATAKVQDPKLFLNVLQFSGLDDNARPEELTTEALKGLVRELDGAKEAQARGPKGKDGSLFDGGKKDRG